MTGRAAAALLVAALAVPSAAVAADEPLVGDPVFSYTDQRIDESSGLVARDGLVVTVNDSGDSNRIFTVDPATGRTVGVTSWQGEAVDIEALAPAGKGRVWVGDIGDNNAARDSVTIARVPFGRGDRTVTAPTYELVYPDGAHDAESLLVDPATGQVLVVAKEFAGRVYAAPSRLDPDRPNRLTEVGRALGLATDGTFLPDGRHLLVRNYGQAAVYAWPDLDRLATVDLPRQPQGEAIAVAESGEILIGTEGAGSQVLRIELPADVTALMVQTPAADEGAGGEDPSDAAPTDVAEDRDWWPWAVGGVAGVLIVGVLVRSLRPR